MADFIGQQKIGRLLYVTRPILSADISAINLAVELVLISPTESADKIGRFYRSSVIGFSCSRIWLEQQIRTAAVWSKSAQYKQYDHDRVID